jgi:two-component sensor histidine kinase
LPAAAIEPVAVPLRRLIADILDPYVQANSEKFSLIGPEVSISPKAITGVALILHELATNAAKYGALGHPGGRLLVSWTTIDVLDLQWSERGGPVQAAPSGRGFGSTLIKRTVDGQFKGTIDYRWEAHGLDIAIRLPMHAL